MKEEQPNRIKEEILAHSRIFYAIFIVIAVLILVRLLWIQFGSAEIKYNAARLEGRIFSERNIPALRGSILARDGSPLATSLLRYGVEFDFNAPGLNNVERYTEQSDSLSVLLAAFFGDKSAADYRKMFREERTARRRSFDIFPRDVDLAEWDVLRKYPLLNWNMGMVYQRVDSDERIYPQGELARRTIGRTGDQGNYGLENAYREELAGRDGKERLQRFARGVTRRVPDDYVPPENGFDVMTTLDPELQEAADSALRKQLTEQNAVWGTTIVMEVKTGEILAMANLGRGGNGEYTERENYAVGRSMEPGSTFKLTSMIALLDGAHMSPAQTYETNNGYPVDIGPAKNIADSHHGDHEIAFRRAVAMSSNVYFATAIWDHFGITGKKQQYSDFLHNKLHLGTTFGLERLGERPSSVTTDWKVADPGVMLVKMAYGYRVKLAPIQTLVLYNAIANGGRMISPLLVRELRRGDSVKRFTARVIDSAICTPATLHTIQNALEAVSTEGTTSLYFKDAARLKVASKSGTAQITDSRSRAGRYYFGTVVAYFPADNPRYTVLTAIQTYAQPGKAFYGAPLSGPVVKDVVDYIYDHSNGSVSNAPAIYRPDAIKGGEIDQIRTVADKLSANLTADGQTGWGTVRRDSLSHTPVLVAQSDDKATMPDVRGMGLKDALFLLEQRGLKVQFTGVGSIAEQSIAAGEAIQRGDTIKLTMDN